MASAMADMMTMRERDGDESRAARSYPRHRKGRLLVAMIALRFCRAIMRPCHVPYATVLLTPFIIYPFPAI